MRPSGEKLNVGVIGLGVGAAHARAFAAHERCRLAAVCDFSPIRLQEASKEHPGVALTTHDRDILTDPAIQIVVVASYDDHHYRQVMSALNNGKHVLVEKPLCLLRHEAEDIRSKLGENPGLLLTSNLSLRTCPRFIRVRNAVGNGEMGAIYSLDGDYLWGRKYKLTEGWRKDVRHYSIILGAAVHMVDLAMWILCRRPVEVSAFCNGISTAGSGPVGGDFASISLLFDDGCVGRITAHGGCVHPHFHGLSVFGANRTFLHALSGSRWLFPDGDGFSSEECVEPYPARDKRRGVIDAFVSAVLGGPREALIDENAVFDAMSVCFAAQTSVEKRCVVAVEYL